MLQSAQKRSVKKIEKTFNFNPHTRKRPVVRGANSEEWKRCTSLRKRLTKGGKLVGVVSLQLRREQALCLKDLAPHMGKRGRGKIRCIRSDEEKWTR